MSSNDTPNAMNPAGTPTGDRPLALVVDDSAVVRRMVGAMLRQLGFDTVEAADGIALLEQAARHPIELVITDLNMPQMDGLTACRQLRQSRPDLPLIMLTTYEQQRADALAAGVNVVLTKPAGPGAIRGAIETARAAVGA